MRRSARTAAAMKNLRHRLDARAGAQPSAQDNIVRAGPGGTRTVDPDLRALIDAAVAKRDGGDGAG